MPARQNLSLYRVQDHVATFEDAVVDDVHLASLELNGAFDFEGRLYVTSTRPREPAWADFLQSGFGKIPGIAKSANNSAVLLLRTKYYKDRLFAITFGQGRHLLRDEVVLRNYGLRVVLNAVTKGEEASNEDFVRIRSVESKTLAPNSLRINRQSAHKAAIELFEVDTFRDILNAATGLPVDTEKWGGRISGGNALHLSIDLSFAELGQLCRLAERTFQSDAYKERYGWIDNISPVVEPSVCEALDNEIVARIQAGKTAGLELGAPEIIRWEQVNHVCFSVATAEKFHDFALADYVAILADTGKLATLTAKHLRTTHRVRVRDAEGADLHDWPVVRCMTGELKVRGKQYLVSDGVYFQVASAYLELLNDFVSKVPACTISLPTADEADEGVYNTEAATSPDLLCLDKKLVRVESRTTPIEPCDLLSTTGHLIHVKRKYGSAALSHLFAQGAVSADLMVSEPAFRKALQKVVEAAEDERCTAEGSDTCRGKFAKFGDTAFHPSKYEVVFAVIGSWSKAPLPTWMPFFSKVNFRRHVSDLRRMGYRVSLAEIDLL